MPREKSRDETADEHSLEFYFTLLAGGEAAVGLEECPPFGIEYPGIWYRPNVLDERVFYSMQDLPDLLAKAFISKSPGGEEIRGKSV